MSTPNPDSVRRRATALGPTEVFVLRCWGRDLYDAFGAMPYLVGSVVRDEAWRDVDVRMMLDPDDPLLIDRVRLTVLSHAVTMWGQRATGLPIDFQFQARDEANAEFKGNRQALGITLTLPWGRPDQPYGPDKNPNQGRGVDLDRTEGDGAPRFAADAGIGGSHDGSDGRVGHDHAGAASELKPATDGDRASDPPGANPAQIDGSADGAP